MLIGIGYKMRQGKDTIADYLLKEYNFSKVSFGSFLKLEIYGDRAPIIIYNELIDAIYLRSYYTNDDFILHKHGVYMELFSRFKEYIMKNNDMNVQPLYLKFALEYGKKDRKLLQLWGDYRRDIFGKNYFVRMAKDKIQYLQKFEIDVVVPDVRFKNEANMIKEMGGIILNVFGRDIYEGSDVMGHRSETELDDFLFDYYIKNDSTLDVLYREVDKFVEWVKRMEG